LRLKTIRKARRITFFQREKNGATTGSGENGYAGEAHTRGERKEKASGILGGGGGGGLFKSEGKEKKIGNEKRNNGSSLGLFFQHRGGKGSGLSGWVGRLNLSLERTKLKKGGGTSHRVL